MTQDIITYYIPQNLNITKGKIYNLYINKVNNLDLSQIIINKTTNNINIPTTKQNNHNISLTEEDYKEIISLADISTKLYNQSQNIVKKLSMERNRK